MSNLSTICPDGTSLILMELEDIKLKNVIASMLILVSILAIIENGAILFVLYKLRSCNQFKTFHILVCSLASSDFLAGSVVAPLLVSQLVNHKLSERCSIEKLRFYMFTITVGSSVLTLAFISYDRYSRLVRSFKYFVPRKTLLVAVCSCWFIPVGGDAIHAIINSPSRLYGVAVIVFLITIAGITITSYISVCTALSRHRKNYASIQLKRTLMTRERRVGHTVLIILASYLIMIIPLIVHYCLLETQHFTYKETLSKTYVIALSFCIANSTVNPLIIGYRTADIRKYFKLHKKGKNKKQKETLELRKSAFAIITADKRETCAED